MAAAKKEKTLAGYVDEARGVFRDHGGALASGTKRTCVADVLWVLLQELEYHGHAGGRARLDHARQPGREYAVHSRRRLRCHARLRARVRFEGVPAGQGRLRLPLAFARPRLLPRSAARDDRPTDPEPPDLHVVAYDGKTIRDNNKYTKVPYSSPYPSPYPCPHLTSLTLGENPRAVRSDQGGRAPRVRLSLQWPRGAH